MKKHVGGHRAEDSPGVEGAVDGQGVEVEVLVDPVAEPPGFSFQCR
jgi:hypothetical protein